MIENKADWCVNRYLQFAGRRVEEERTEEGENRSLTDSIYNTNDVF